MNQASIDTSQDDSYSTNSVQLIATVVHKDTAVFTQVPGNVELPKPSRLLMPTSGRGTPWLLMPVIGGGTPPVLPATGEPIVEAIKNTAVRNNNLAPDLISHGTDNGDEALFQPSDVTKPPKVREYDAMTTQSAEMLNEDNEMQVAAAKWIDLFIESDVNYSAS